MANKFAWASIDERGKARGGRRGDQTGREVKVGDYYNFGQDKVIRFVDVKKARIAADIAKVIAKDNQCGYSQSDRGSLFSECARLDWNANKIKKAIKNKTFPKCNTDCSAFVATCINIAFGKKLVVCFSTATMESETSDKYPQHFKKLSITEASAKWRKGDMPVKAGHHVIINV